MFNGIPLFSGLTESEMSTIALFAQERKINAGTLLFSENDDATAMYIVKTGKLKIYRDRSSGEISLGFIQPGEIVGEMALFDATAPKKRLASVKAVEDTLVVVIMLLWSFLGNIQRYIQRFSRSFEDAMKRTTPKDKQESNDF